MAEWALADDLRTLAARVAKRRPDLWHIEIPTILFLRELEEAPKTSTGRVLARTYRFAKHPIGFFTGCAWGIVVYDQHTDHLSPQQLAILLWHEMRHIPEQGDKLVDHDVQDFYAVLGTAGLGWADPGAEVPDILAPGEVSRNVEKTAPDEEGAGTDRGAGEPGEPPAEDRRGL